MCSNQENKGNQELKVSKFRFGKYAQDSKLRSFFGRIENTINCFRDLLTFSYLSLGTKKSGKLFFFQKLSLGIFSGLLPKKLDSAVLGYLHPIAILIHKKTSPKIKFSRAEKLQVFLQWPCAALLPFPCQNRFLSKFSNFSHNGRNLKVY